MSKVKSVFLSGGNRGIGFQLVQEITKKLKPAHLFATFRNVERAKELQEFAGNHSSVHLIQLDVREDSKFDDVVNQIDRIAGDDGLNLLINNAGISSKYSRLSVVRKESLIENYEVNAVAPILLTKALLPLIEKGAQKSGITTYGISRGAVINISSILGSIGANANGAMYPYRCSKAALNAATKSMSIDFRNERILAVALHPGWVQTDMGGPKAPLTSIQSASGIVDFLTKLGEDNNGNFYEFNGNKLEW